MRNVIPFSRLCAAVVCLPFLVSCGGKTQSGGTPDAGGIVGSDCRPSVARFSSADAVAIARCSPQLPADARLCGVQNQAYNMADDTLDATGRAPSWHSAYVDSSGIHWTVQSDASGALVTQDKLWGNRYRLDKELDPFLSSSIIVPDAVARLAARGVQLPEGTGFLFGAPAGCWLEGSMPPSSPEIHVTILRKSTDSSAQPEWWNVYYDNRTGAFLRRCGPCEKTGPEWCKNCSTD